MGKQTEIQPSFSTDHRVVDIAAHEVYLCLVDGDAPSEESLKKLFDSIADCIMKKEVHGKLHEQLTTLVDDYFNYNIMSDDEEIAFDLGACWSLLTAYRHASEKVAEEQQSQEDIRLIERYRGIFFELKTEPNIRHSELAQRTGLKISRLSQIMSRLSGMGLVSSVKMGREKRYSLTRQAEEKLLHPFGISDGNFELREPSDFAAAFIVSQNEFSDENYTYSHITTLKHLRLRTPKRKQNTESKKNSRWTEGNAFSSYSEAIQKGQFLNGWSKAAPISYETIH